MPIAGDGNPALRLDRLAEAVSGVFHPFLVVIPTMVIVMMQTGVLLLHALGWTVLSVCVVLIPLTIMIYSGVRSGRYSDPSVSIREQRHSIYWAAGLFMGTLVFILFLAGAPIVLIACFASAILSVILGYTLNSRFTKLSLHSVAMAGCACVLALTVPVLGVAMAALAPLVGWARIRLRHHTPLQILIGWLVSAFSVFLAFHMFHLLPWQS